MYSCLRNLHYWSEIRFRVVGSHSHNFFATHVSFHFSVPEMTSRRRG